MVLGTLKLRPAKHIPRSQPDINYLLTPIYTPMRSVAAISYRGPIQFVMIPPANSGESRINTYTEWLYARYVAGWIIHGVC
jgi:hypothetical protein